MDFYIFVKRSHILHELCSQGVIYVNESGIFMIEDGNLRKPFQKEIDNFLQIYCNDEKILDDDLVIL